MVENQGKILYPEVIKSDILADGNGHTKKRPTQCVGDKPECKLLILPVNAKKRQVDHRQCTILDVAGACVFIKPELVSRKAFPQIRLTDPHDRLLFPVLGAGP